MKNKKTYLLSLIILLLFSCGLKILENRKQLPNSEAFFEGKQITVKIDAADRSEFIKICRDYHTAIYGEGRLDSCDVCIIRNEYSAEAESFYIDHRPVSASEFVEYAKNNDISRRYIAKYLSEQGISKEDYWQYPAIGVSWVEASSYCESQGKRLPTRDEYEIVMYKGEIFPWDFYKELCLRYEKDVPSRLCRIGEYEKDVGNNGVIDVYSNIMEWTSNTMKDERHGIFRDIISTIPLDHIYKGASYKMSPRALFVFYERSDGNDRERTIGFRCARDAEEQEKEATEKEGGE